MENKINKKIEQVQKEMKENYFDLLKDDGFDVSKKMSAQDFFNEAEEVEMQEYESLSYDIGYVDGLKTALNLLRV